MVSNVSKLNIYIAPIAQSREQYKSWEAVR